MAGNFSFWSMLTQGGWTMVVLFFCSVVSLGIIAERCWTYAKNKVDKDILLDKIGQALKHKDVMEAIALCDQTGGSMGRTLKAGLAKASKGTKLMGDALGQKAKEEILSLGKYVSTVGTIGNIAPFIGLFGTVLGVIRAFKDIAMAGSGGMAVVMNGIAEALITTAAGLFVAVPAVIGYNYLINTLDRLGEELENSSDQLVSLVEELER